MARRAAQQEHDTLQAVQTLHARLLGEPVDPASVEAVMGLRFPGWLDAGDPRGAAAARLLDLWRAAEAGGLVTHDEARDADTDVVETLALALRDPDALRFDRLVRYVLRRLVRGHRVPRGVQDALTRQARGDLRPFP